MNKALLRSIMVLHGETNKNLAKLLEISVASVSDRLNERNGVEFKQGEIAKIKDHYNLTAEQIADIFFA